MLFARLPNSGDIRKLIEALNHKDQPVALDTETDSTDPHKATLIDFQLTGIEHDAVCIPAEHVSLLQELRVPLILHNFKYDYVVLKRHGVDILRNRIIDTMLLSHLSDENRASHSLSSWTKELWNDNYKEEFWSKTESYLGASEDERLAYSCRDIYYTGLLYTELASRLKRDSIPQTLVDNQVEFAKVLAETEYRGIKVDLPYLTEIGVKLRSQIEILKPQMRAMVDFHVTDWELEKWLEKIEEKKTPKGRKNVPKPEFNFDSSIQLLDLLYDRLGLPQQRNEKTRRPSVDDASLQRLKDHHPLISVLQEYRGINKVYNSFIEGTLSRIQDERIYPSFNVIGTVTGRTSSSNPNLQQLPSTGGVRGIYIPDPGSVLISADYSQLEVTIAAHFSQDKNLLKIVRDGASQHDITAESLKIPRPQAKTLNFGMQYRCSAWKVAKILGVSHQEAEHIWNKYWETYSGLKRLMDECDAKVDRGESIQNPFGRKRRFTVAKRQPWDSAYRQAFNALIQGTGADLTDLAFTNAAKRLREADIGIGMFVVHDEAICQAVKGKEEEARQVIVDAMVGIGEEIKLTVPLKVECTEGQLRWED